MLGRKKYSPPRSSTKLGRLVQTKGGLAGVVSPWMTYFSPSAAVIAHEQVFVVAEVRVVAVGDPLLLHELELAGDAGVEGHEDDSAVGGVELGWVGSVASSGTRGHRAGRGG